MRGALGCLLGVVLLLTLTACTADELTADDIVGVWRTEGFVENTLAGFPDPYVANDLIDW